MAEINVNGRMLVKNFKKQFQEAFGCSLRVYVKTHFADDEQTLASLREEGKKGGELSVKGNMLVGNFEAKMLEEYGITVQVANIDDTKLVDNSLTLAAAGRGEERKAVKKAEKVTSAKQQADTPKPTAVEQPKTAEGAKEQFEVVLTGKAIFNAPYESHEDCNDITLSCYSSKDIWEYLYVPSPINLTSLGNEELGDDESLSLNVQNVKINSETAEGSGFNLDATFKLGSCESFDKPCNDEGYVGLLECKFTATMQLELSDASAFDINKLELTLGDYDSLTLQYDGESVSADFNFEATRLIGYTDGEKISDHSYEAPVPLVELVDKYQGSVLEIALLVERDDGCFASDEAEEQYMDSLVELVVKGHQLVNEYTGKEFDIEDLDEPCLVEELPDRLAHAQDLNPWVGMEGGYDLEARFVERKDGDIVDAWSTILVESWS